MIRRAWILGGLLALSPAVSQAALLMLVDAVPGTATLPGYVGWFTLRSLQWGIDRSNTATPHSVHVTLEVSAGTATLHQAAATGGAFKKIAIDQVSTVDGGNVTLVTRLICEESLIRATSTGHDSDDRGVIALDIRCGRLAWEYFDYSSGTPKTLVRQGKGSWNFKTNTP